MKSFSKVICVMLFLSLFVQPVLGSIDNEVSQDVDGPDLEELFADPDNKVEPPEDWKEAKKNLDRKRAEQEKVNEAMSEGRTYTPPSPFPKSNPVPAEDIPAPKPVPQSRFQEYTLEDANSAEKRLAPQLRRMEERINGQDRKISELASKVEMLDKTLQRIIPDLREVEYKVTVMGNRQAAQPQQRQVQQSYSRPATQAAPVVRRVVQPAPAPKKTYYYRSR